MANSQLYGLFQLLDHSIINPNEQARLLDSGLLISAIEYDQQRHNADIDAMLRLFTMETTEYSQEVTQTGSSRNQPLDENGRAKPIKPGAPYTVAWPLQASGSAHGANYVTRIKMTARDLARTMAQMYRGDYLWVQEHILGAFFANTSYTWTDITGRGALTIRGLANGDATTYYKTGSNTLATDTHYLAQAAGIADATNPYPTIKSELVEHPENTGEVVAFIATDLVTTTQALAEFRSAQLDADIQLPNTATVLTGSLDMTLPPGAVIKGKTDSGVWIVEWPAMPSGYILAITTGGPKPLARRVFEEDVLRGFRPQGTREDFPYFEEQWARWEGYGAFNRVGAVAVRIGNASWAVPTNYGMPMP